jgi:hypothetical protein
MIPPNKVEILPGRFAIVHEIAPTRADNHAQLVQSKQQGTISADAPMYTPSLKTSNHSDLLKQQWKDRVSKITNLKQLPFDSPVLLSNWTGLHTDVLDRLETVYQVIDSGTTQVYNSATSYFLDARFHTTLDLTPGNTYLYYGEHVHRKKPIHKHWKNKTDPRSFKTIDETYYSKYINKHNNIFPNIALAATGFITNRHPGLPMIITGLDITDLSANDQQHLKRTNITCI